MTYSDETAGQLESLYRQHLEEAFQGTLAFDPITVEVTENMFDRDAFRVTVVYHGDGRLLDPGKLNRISSLMVDEASGLGIEQTIIESYADVREYVSQEPRIDEPLAEIIGNQPWHEMLNIARHFLNTGNRPNEAELSLGVDCCYFAMYHALGHSNAQSLAGRLRKERPGDWSRVYMGMDENSITPRFRHYRPQGSQPVNDFSAAFAILQEHRDRAMERLGTSYLPSEVARLIQRAESAIIALESLSQDERRSLAMNLLVGNVHGKGPNIITATDADRTSTGGWVGPRETNRNP